MGIVLTAGLVATVPTTGDLGLTWDEPAYRYSQLMSSQWWEQLAHARTVADVRALLEPDTLLYYWPYGRHGINFHPPLAGQLNLATYAVFGTWLKDIHARRLASVFEYALTIAIGFGFLARRYGPWVGGVAAGALLLMPRVYGDAHVAGTDIPGLLLWVATAVAFWKGLTEPRADGWRVLVGILLGLSFLEKMAAVGVLVPLLAWLVVARLPATFRSRADWIDGVATSTAMLVPLAIAFREIVRLSRAFLQIQERLGVPGPLISPARTDLFHHRPDTDYSGLILAVPLLIWLIRRLFARVFRASAVWGVERPALEIWTAILAFAPVVGWLGNPAWWRETLPRLAHYYAINTERRGVLPDIDIVYRGQTYIYSLPWHNAWVLIGITVPAAILVVGAVGVLYALRNAARDRLPLYFLIHLLTLPVLRMLPTPAHDGVRLLLPTFFFLAAFAGWGSIWSADGLARLTRVRAIWTRSLVAALVLGPAGWQLVRIHPFELSYYNELIGGPAGAWHSGFELSYWYDAFNGRTLTELNAKFPSGVAVDFFNAKDEPPTFAELQTLGLLRGDLILGTPRAEQLPYIWLLTHDSKALSFTRLLFAMRPWYQRAPRQLDGVQVAAVADPVAVSRAWALRLLTDPSATRATARDHAPPWVRQNVPWLGRFWGEGLMKAPRLEVNEAIFAWARRDPAELRAAARAVANRGAIAKGTPAARLVAILTRFDRPTEPGGRLLERLLLARPEALTEAVEILLARPGAVRTVLTRYPYTDPCTIGGYLDDGLKPK
jgi:4-amino-4-deoxy-L-arabinose transferase-like glycosyltransferase